MKNNIYLYILTVAVTIYLIRVLPLTIIRKPIRSRFIRDFLYYVPYVTLSVMTFPAIIRVTSRPLSGMISLFFGIIAAYKEMGLFKVTLICCFTVLILEFLI